MCGICGVIGPQPIDEAELTRMTEVMGHRGPDAHGIFTEKVTDDLFIGLGHRRLSIIDLSSEANQPMTDEGSGVTVVFNGEIYNFIELRSQLEREGLSFKTHCDTEVLLKAYLHWKISFLERLNGMFALGLWDPRSKRLLLSRDRLGIKPLYYFTAANTFAFASELKALTVLPRFQKDIDLQSLNDYFSLQYVPTPRTIFKNVFKLEPGHFLLFEDRQVKIEKYWDLEYSPDNLIHDVGEIQDRLRFLVRDAVEKQMISDVPLGAFLSGGIDSALVVANMARASTAPVKTFTIGFDTPGFRDEMALARITARKFGTDHHEEVLTVGNLLDWLPELAYQMDEPFADHSMIPTYLVSKLTREKVTVALSGDGGDENFGGYPRKYRFAKFYGSYEKLPPALRRIAERALGSCSSLILASGAVAERKLSRLIEILSSEGDEQAFAQSFMLTASFKDRLYARSFKQAIRHNFSPSIFDRDRQPVLNAITDRTQWAMAHDLKNYMVDDILTKVDRMSMLNSLEVRVPLLDHRIVELGLKIPVKYKLKGRTTKWILRETFKDILPSEVLAGRKQGFGIPIKTWGSSAVNHFAKEILLDGRSRARKLFDYDFIERIVDNKEENYSTEIWGILGFELWAMKYLG